MFWGRQTFVQGFIFEDVTLKQDINRFEIMEIADNVY